MKSADIEVGEIYSFLPGKYATPVPVKVLAVGRYSSYSRWKPGDEPQRYHSPIAVIERDYGDKRGVLQLNVPLSQIKGLWSELAPIYEAEERAERARATERKMIADDRTRRWTAVKRQLDALGLEFELPTWRSGDPVAPIQLSTLEGLLERIDK